MFGKEKKMSTLRLKRATLFCFGFAFFLFPGQSYYLTMRADANTPIASVVNISLPPPAPYPVNTTGVNSPALSAYSAIVLDYDSRVVMYGKNEKVWLLPASTVKIMTALVSLDHYQDLEEVITVRDASDAGQDMQLVAGERIRVKDLLYGLLVSSANDAALILAQNFPGGEENFVKAMNQKASQLNLLDTYFANPTGLDSSSNGEILSDYSYTTAYDLARLAAWALKNPVFSQIISTPEITVSDVDGKIKHRLFTINELLGKVEGLKGVKTGWTEDAGQCFVSFTQRNGRSIITAILNSQDRFGETVKLIDWAFTNHEWQDLTPSI